MNILNTLIVAATLTGSIQPANATEAYIDIDNLGNYTNGNAVLGLTLDGYWRTDDGNGGWKKNDELGDHHGINNWNDCYKACTADMNCTGVEFQSSNNGHNKCEIHYDSFRYCEQTSSNDGSQHGKRSICWVNGNYDSYTDNDEY